MVGFVSFSQIQRLEKILPKFMGYAVGPGSPERPSGEERHLSLWQPSAALGLAGVTHGGQGMVRLRDT